MLSNPIVGKSAELQDVLSVGSGQVLIRFSDALDLPRMMIDRRHDMDTALRTMTIAIQALQAGYHFDDVRAPAKLACMTEAMSVLTSEGAMLRRIYDSMIEEIQDR